ncbi:uncharacterized protein with NAD-binding domain and iron-sulfur cluster [Kibdelosporangium banguiense]|uniref:Uncharacterized protein with NAD-binding domain and iron-sulfur cluster n=1 Tax=Kibdelosporangium banguiense TaxID=1365924 RepID=A0ABS4TJ85_9PSEU|nr:FAD-dependent oxidoreductase [Kibdelosporangium banguiense]MBP2324465.1 uncharacterized protein with NAD-binding domain and iron-sulfur cluster [Kibdelosporangium banguiense]
MADDVHSSNTSEQPGIDRRRFLGTLAAGAAVAGAAGFGITPAAQAVPGARSAGRRVAVFGGGMGGLTVAHELAERGYQVTVYERKAWGGKCRSMPSPGTGTGGRLDLPGEHGFRFFPGFYQNLPDSMSRIPLPGGGTARDNLVSGREEVAFYKGITLKLPAEGSIGGTLSPQSLLAFLQTALQLGALVPAHEVAYFLQKIIVFVTSGPKRRLGQWEKMSFADFVRSSRMSQTYRDVLVDMFTSTLVAAKPDKANTRTMGLMAEAWAYSTLGLGGYSPPDRLLNAPTNEALIDPWLEHLRSLGVTFHLGATLTDLQVSNRAISGARVTTATGTSTVDADHYVLAVPVERAVPLLNADILAADPSLASLRKLTTDWMNGVMLYLKRPLNLSDGHVTYPGQPWALTSISQGQFWRKKFADTYGDGTVQDCLSLDLSAWDKPGVLYGKPAKQCTPAEIIDEIKEQLRRSIPFGPAVLPDSLIHSHFIDPAITGTGTPGAANDEPLLINTPGSWNYRPEARTAIPNLYLASDYVRADINLATMEAANEAGRKAANAIIDNSGGSEPHAKLFTLYQPREFALIHADDDLRYSLRLPNAYDIIDPFWP